MPRTRSLAWSELKLGIVGIVAIVLAGLLIVSVGGEAGFPWQRYSLKTRFGDVGGLKTGAVVRVSGKEVGKVTSVEFAGAAIDVSMQLTKSVRPLITTDSVAALGSLSLLGEPIIDISAAPQGQPLPDWAYVPSAPPAAKISDVTASASRGLDEAAKLLVDVRNGRGTIGKLFTDQAVYNQLDQFVTSANRVATALESTRGTAGALINERKAYDDLSASLAHLNALTTSLNNGEGPLGALLKDQATEANLKSTVASVNHITGQIDQGQGTMGKLINDRELYDKLDRMADHLTELTDTLNRGSGTIPQLVHNRELYDNLNSAVNELKGLLGDIRKDPRKYLNVHVSIF